MRVDHHLVLRGVSVPALIDAGSSPADKIRSLTKRAFRDADKDIVYRDGKFVQYPKGTINE